MAQLPGSFGPGMPRLLAEVGHLVTGPPGIVTASWCNMGPGSSSPVRNHHIRFTMNSAGCLYMAFWPESARLEYTPVSDRQECPDARYFFRRRLRTLAFVPSGKASFSPVAAACHGMNSSLYRGLLTGSQSKGMDTLLPSKRRIRPQHPPGGLHSPG